MHSLTRVWTRSSPWCRSPDRSFTCPGWFRPASSAAVRFHAGVQLACSIIWGRRPIHSTKRCYSPDSAATALTRLLPRFRSWLWTLFNRSCSCYCSIRWSLRWCGCLWTRSGISWCQRWKKSSFWIRSRKYWFCCLWPSPEFSWEYWNTHLWSCVLRSWDGTGSPPRPWWSLLCCCVRVCLWLCSLIAAKSLSYTLRTCSPWVADCSSCSLSNLWTRTTHCSC